MNEFCVKYGQWAVVAGSGEGIGAAFSYELAKKGQNILLVDKNTSTISHVAEEINYKYGRETKALILDLSEKGSVTEILNTIARIDCRMLVYNAAYGPVKPFLSNTEEELDYYVSLNSRTLLHLLHSFLRQAGTQSAGVVIMSSLAGLYGTNLVAPYGATKAFDFNLGEALYHEFKGAGKDIMACCAGATDTPNYRNTYPKYGWIKPSVMDPGDVAKQSLKMLGKRGLYIPGFKNQLTEFFFRRVLSRKMAARLMNKTMMNMYRDVI